MTEPEDGGPRRRDAAGAPDAGPADPALGGGRALGVEPASRAERVFDSLLDAAHLAPPHDLPRLVAEHAVMLGAQDAVIYLADLQQTVLTPFLGTLVKPELQHDVLSVDSSLAGRCFQLTAVQQQSLGHAAAGVVVWYPVLDGTERLGVLGVVVDHNVLLGAGWDLLGLRLRRLAALVAELVVTKSLYGDSVIRARRTAPMSLAAEVQWGLLPPLTFACHEATIAGALEPAYQVAGDSVDYAVDPGYARLAIFDGMGHGLDSALLTSLTVAAYRNARRGGKPLVLTALDVDDAVHSIYGGTAFATGILAELDLGSGVLRWVCAGHPPPLLLRHGARARALQVQPSLPFGLEAALAAERGFAVGVERLEPQDRVVFYSDGVTEARAPDGSLFGVERLVDLLGRHSDDDVPPPEAVRRLVRALMAHQQGHLTDDATLLMVEWRSGRQDVLLPGPPRAGGPSAV